MLAIKNLYILHAVSHVISSSVSNFFCIYETQIPNTMRSTLQPMPYVIHLTHGSYPFQIFPSSLLSAPKSFRAFSQPVGHPPLLPTQEYYLHIYIEAPWPLHSAASGACLFALMSEVCRPHSHSLFICSQDWLKQKSLIEHKMGHLTFFKLPTLMGFISNHKHPVV